MEPEKIQLLLNKSTISTENVPTLISKEQQEILFSGDADPYFITQEIDFEEEANGIEYRSEFFDSFLGKLKTNAIPGSRDGHQTWTESGAKRANNDLYLVGGKVDAKNKKAIFKNYIPPQGESGDNAEFIKNAKLGLINFSLVTYAKLHIEIDNDTGEEYWYITESLRGERNDAVGRQEGAMAQEIIKNKQEAKMAEKTLTLIEQIKNALKAGTLDISEFIPPDKLINAEQLESITAMNLLCEEFGGKPSEVVENYKALNTQVFELSRDALLKKAFGPEKFDNGDINSCRAAASRMIPAEVKTEKALKNKIAELQKDDFIISLNKHNLDPNTAKTEVKPGAGHVKNKGAEDDGPRTMEA